MNMKSLVVPSGAALALALVLSACSQMPARVESVVVVAEAEANHSTTSAVDLVFVFDPALLALMPNNSAQWFEQRPSLLAAAGSGIEVVAMQVPPATMANVPLPSKSGKALAVLVYVSFAEDAGRAVGNVTGHREIEIRLAKDSVIYGGK